MHIYKHNRIEWWSCRIIISPLDLSFMHIIWFKSIYNHMKQNNREEWFLLKKKKSAWSGWVSVCVCVPVCMRVYSYMNSCMRILRVFLSIFGVCACMCLDYLIENLPIYSSIAEMYGSYSSATSSHKGQFVLCKKTILRIFLFSPSGLSPPIFYNPGALLLIWSIGGRCYPPNQKEPLTTEIRKWLVIKYMII